MSACHNDPQNHEFLLLFYFIDMKTKRSTLNLLITEIIQEQGTTTIKKGVAPKTLFYHVFLSTGDIDAGSGKLIQPFCYFLSLDIIHRRLLLATED